MLYNIEKSYIAFGSNIQMYGLKSNKDAKNNELIG